jgi:DNA-binding IscR family transcriptional regulator
MCNQSATPWLESGSNQGTTSEAIAKSLHTNPVAVRKILKLLEREGLVALCQGRHGGVGLRRPASRITLGQIYKAVESETGVFAMRSQVHEDARWPAR